MFRKTTALLLSVFMLLSLSLSFSAVAEEEEEGAIEVSGAYVDTASSPWTVTWTDLGDPTFLESVRAVSEYGDVTLTVLSNSEGYATVDESGVPYGTSVISLAFSSASGAQTAVIDGGSYVHPVQIQSVVSISATEETVSITVTNESGQYVAGIPFSVDIGNTIGAWTGSTDENGQASRSVGEAGGCLWVVHVADYDAGGGVSYFGCSGSVDVPGGVVSEPEDEPSEPEYSEPEDEPSEPEPTVRPTAPEAPTLPKDDDVGTAEIPEYKASRGKVECAALEDGRYALHFSVDSTLLKKMKLNMSAFDKSGRVIISKDTYDTLTKFYGSEKIKVLTGALTNSPFPAVTSAMIKKSKSSESAFSDSTAEKAKSVTFGFALDLQSGDPVTDLSSLGEGMQFEVQIPIPKEMKKCKSFGIAATGKDVLSEMKQPLVQNGTISFVATVGQYYTLVGFTDGKPMAGIKEGMSPILKWVVLFVVAGVVLLACCGFFIYWWFIRPKRKRGNAAMDYEDPEDDTYHDDEMPPFDGEEEQDTFFSDDYDKKAEDKDAVDILSRMEPEEDIFGLYSRRIDD